MRLVVVDMDKIIGTPVHAEHGSCVAFRNDVAPHLHVKFPKIFVARAFSVFPHHVPRVLGACGEVMARGLILEIEVVGGGRPFSHEHVGVSRRHFAEFGKGGLIGSWRFEAKRLVVVVADDVVFSTVNNVVGHSRQGECEKADA